MPENIKEVDNIENNPEKSKKMSKNVYEDIKKGQNDPQRDLERVRDLQYLSSQANNANNTKKNYNSDSMIICML